MKMLKESQKVAKLLFEKGINADALTKEEIFSLTGLNLKEVSRSEELTVDYFKTLVAFDLEVMRKSN